jgi:hypothetical protein
MALRRSVAEDVALQSPPNGNGATLPAMRPCGRTSGAARLERRSPTCLQSGEARERIAAAGRAVTTCRCGVPVRPAHAPAIESVAVGTGPHNHCLAMAGRRYSHRGGRAPCGEWVETSTACACSRDIPAPGRPRAPMTLHCRARGRVGCGMTSRQLPCRALPRARAAVWIIGRPDTLPQ